MGFGIMVKFMLTIKLKLADILLKESTITIILDDLVRPEEHILLEIRTLDLPAVKFLFQVIKI